MEPDRHTDAAAAAHQVTTGDARAAAWQSGRPRMLAHAYRMLGSWQDAEDVVQEAWLRLAGAGALRNAEAFLTTTVTRLAIDRLRVRQRRQEDYIGPWIAEPVATDRLPDEAAVDRDLLSLAAVQLLERLTAPERATYVLRTGFAYSYQEIGAVIDHTEASCRQLFRRATARLGGDARFDTDAETHRRLLEALVAASRDGALADLEAVLADDTVLWADGGGRVSSALNPVRGADKVARFMIGICRSGVRWTPMQVNGFPALEFYGDASRRVIALRVQDGRIAEIMFVGNPDKLTLV
ncbi:sigma-70 family RNA polymerase sigma factor [Flexivirga sp. ID2601S]|uniref:Sigma-70 family RNA polymerase sigma factor n=1 Tax=Flexivirga aerilata TaxID=1656889 RepID=A0A849AEH8_9MICO|nr:sigma-70 family RNA polymerase sigma factor [Flexivirga aerilata]